MALLPFRCIGGGRVFPVSVDVCVCRQPAELYEIQRIRLHAVERTRRRRGRCSNDGFRFCGRISGGRRAAAGRAEKSFLDRLTHESTELIREFGVVRSGGSGFRSLLERQPWRSQDQASKQDPDERLHAACFSSLSACSISLNEGRTRDGAARRATSTHMFTGFLWRLETSTSPIIA